MGVFVFRIEVADIPIEIHSKFRVRAKFFQNYLTRKEPLFTIRPQERDIQSIQNRLKLLDSTEGTNQYTENVITLENMAIQELIAEKLVDFNVLLMHGSAIGIDGHAFIFTAPSGTGKSTHVRLWRERFGDKVTRINDDKPMIRIKNEQAVVYGNPWAGKHHIATNCSFPLTAIVRLYRSEANAMTKLPKVEAFEHVFGQTYRSTNPSTMAKILRMEKQLLNLVECYSLRCNMLPEAAELSWNVLSKCSGKVRINDNL